MATFLDLLGQTAEYQRLKAAGLSDQEIMAAIGSPDAGATGMTLGNTALMGLSNQAAGIQSNYNLGRGNLAQGLIQNEYQRQANPFNIVTALQEYADTGRSNLLADPRLHNIAPGPASPYQAWLKSLYADQPGAQGGSLLGTPAPAPAAADPWAAFRGRSPEELGNFRAAYGGGGAPAPAGPAGPSSLEDRFLGTAPASQTAQQAAAGLLGRSMNVGLSGGGGEFKSTLQGGGVPGIGTFTENDWGRMTPDQQQAYLGTVASPGRVSDPAAALAAYQARHSMGALGPGTPRTFRLGTVQY